jgi:hypothetical protein
VGDVVTVTRGAYAGLDIVTEQANALAGVAGRPGFRTVLQFDCG